MNVERYGDGAAPRIAAAIGEPARARMLYALVDNRARTSTELALIAGVSPSTASVHLQRLKADRLVSVRVQGKHRYYSLRDADVASVLEALSVVAGRSPARFVPPAPDPLCAARTCYDHAAGSFGVLLHDRLHALGWLSASSIRNDDSYDLTAAGIKGFESIGINLDETRALRRRFAFGCLDWSERRPHLGGALGAAMLRMAFTRRWVTQERASRILHPTSLGEREMRRLFGIRI